MRYIFLFWILFGGLVIGVQGCDFLDWHVERENKQEAAVVVDTLHMASHSSTDLSPTISMNDGSMGLSVHTVTIPEQWGVVFRCQHGKFVSQGSTERHKEQWERLDKGMNVVVLYEEVYSVHNETKERKFIRLDFLNATEAKVTGTAGVSSGY